MRSLERIDASIARAEELAEKSHDAATRVFARRELKRLLEERAAAVEAAGGEW